MQLFEILDDRQGLWNAGAIIKLKHWNPTERIDCEKLRRTLFPFVKIYDLQGNLNTLFSQVNANFARVRGLSEVVQFHRALLSTASSQQPPDHNRLVYLKKGYLFLGQPRAVCVRGCLGGASI